MFLNLIDNAPETLDAHTLNELANALADDANYASAIQTQLAFTASIAYVDSGFATKHILLPPASDLAIGRLITRTWISPPGIKYLNLYYKKYTMASLYGYRPHIHKSIVCAQFILINS